MRWGEAYSLPGMAAQQPCCPSPPTLINRLALSEAMSRRDAAKFALVAVFHLAALFVMAANRSRHLADGDFSVCLGRAQFFLAERCCAGRRSPRRCRSALFLALILLSQFKYDKLLMTVNFVDLMILDPDTIAFFLTIYPDLLLQGDRRGAVWQFRFWRWCGGSIPYRVRLRVAAAGAALCLLGAVGSLGRGPDGAV